MDLWPRLLRVTAALSSKDPLRRFREIVANIDAILASADGVPKEQFLADADKYDAAERRLSRISEAAVKLGPQAEDMAPGQPWKEIRGLGNWLRHDYPNVLQEMIWQIIREHLPGLRRDCEQAIAQLLSSS